ncbi:unnamed protein product [Musa textilis]
MLGHIKKNYHIKIKERNIANKEYCSNIKKEGTVIILDKDNDPITLKSVYHIPGIKKNLFSVANAIDVGNYIIFYPNEVKFLHNIKKLNADVIHTSKMVKGLYILLALTSYVDKMSTNDGPSIWYVRLSHINFLKLKIMM